MDRPTYEQWVHDWSDDLYGFAYRLSGRADLAEDLVQETFCQAWRARKQLRDPQRAYGWLFQILRNLWTNYLRDASRRPAIGSGLQQVMDTAPNRDAGVLHRLAISDELQQAIDALEEHYRLPFLMVNMQGLTCQETADQLQTPLGTILSRLHRARELLRQRLSPVDSPAVRQKDPAPPTTRLRIGGAP
jgi:RNA polymerase sigma-70 factor (ECF subfamily)